MLNIELKNTEETENLGGKLALLLKPPFVISLKGELGAGKTTLVRGFLRGLGVDANVKSPTYALVEAYTLSDKTVFHFDLYRIVDPKELEMIGIGEYFNEQAIVFIEWSENGEGYIPNADLQLELIVIPEGRKVNVSFLSKKGQFVMNSLKFYG